MSRQLRALQVAEKQLDGVMGILREFTSEMPSTVNYIDQAWNAVSSMAIALERYEARGPMEAFDATHQLEAFEKRVGLKLHTCEDCRGQFLESKLAGHTCLPRLGE
jgi:hypothetical protein